MKYTKDNFPELVSEPNWFWTWFIRIVFGFMFLLIGVGFFIIPVLFYLEDRIYGSGTFVFMVIYYPLLIWGCVALVRYVLNIRKSYIKTIRVDQRGVHYEKVNGETDSILYSQLERKIISYDSDVYARSENAHGPTLLYVHLKGKTKAVYFSVTDVAFTSYTGNYKKLRTHFIQGIKIFRTDLLISPSVYSEFFINPDTFEFDRKGFWKIIAVVVLVLGLMLVGVELFLRYKHGDSLIP